MRAPKTPAANLADRPAAKPTSEERRILKNEAQAKQKLAREKALMAFDTDRSGHWARIWAKALRLAMCIAGDPEVAEENSWWFEAFSVDPRAQTFKTHDDYHNEVSQGSITLDTIERLERTLDTGQEFFDEFVAEQERQRVAREELANAKNAALATLTDEQRVLLGLPKKFSA